MISVNAALCMSENERSYSSALVTGASGLVGQAIVKKMCAAGMTVHAVSRNAETLKQLSIQTGCVSHAIDITDTSAITELAASLEIDVLVNNAGVAKPGSITNGSLEDIDEQINVNIRSIMHFAHLLLPGMMARDCGHIVSIGSMSGHYNFAGNAAYHATKSAIHMLSRQLRIDLFGHRVRVTEITPGRIKTEMFSKALGKTIKEADQQFFDGFEPLLPDDIAAAVYYAVSAPPHVNVSHIELLPTMQVPGGVQIAKSNPIT